MDAVDVCAALETLLKEVNFHHLLNVQLDSETHVDHEVYVIPEALLPPLSCDTEAPEALTAGNQVVQVSTVSGACHELHVSSPCSGKLLKEAWMKRHRRHSAEI